MTDARKATLWISGLVSVVALFLLLNFLVWFFKLNLLFMPYPNCGDLARIGMAPEIGQCREEKRTQPRLLQHPSPSQPREFPILSFGDSISRGRGGGENNYWQDFVASRSGLDIAWVSEIDDNNYAQDIIRLRNSGYFKKYKVRYLVVQAAERTAITRFTREVNWDEKMPIDQMEARFESLSPMLFTNQRYLHAWDAQKLVRYQADGGLQARAMATQFIFAHAGRLIGGVDAAYRKLTEFSPELFCDRRADESAHPEPAFACEDRPAQTLAGSLFYDAPAVRQLNEDARISFLADGVRTAMPAMINNNYKWAERKVLGLVGADKYVAAAQRWRLDRPLFDSPYADTLLFHLGDYKSNRKFRADAPLRKMHDTLNRLTDILAQDGIKLYFMPTPNKLTIYQDYLAEPIDSKSTFFPRLRALQGKRYVFIDTEQVLSAMVARGEKDVYFVDDTHWSGKALPAIAELFEFK